MPAEIPVPTDRPVRVRIAPSPTGDPHVGTAYIGLFNMVFAKKHGGQFILRIEDTDQTRSTRESEEAIYRSLRWAGLTWDEGPDVGGPCAPYRQSERTELYREHAQRLIDSGHAYRCFATAEELEQMREQQKAKGERLGYDRRFRDCSPDEVERRLAEGQPFVVRLKMPTEGKTTIVDGLRGEITIDNAELDDQILLKSDGFPTYHLANVVDDKLMDITHVIRAEEWIPSTPKHVLLYQAFGWEPPVFVHMPLLRNEDKSKISKRKNPVSLEFYQRAGVLPEAMLNFLGRMGWSMPNEAEKFTLDEMIESFTFDRISLAGPVFGLDKLFWLNGLYLRELTDDQLVDRLQGWLLNREYLLQLAPLVKERISRLDEFVPMTAFFFGDDFQLDPEALLPKKKKDKAEVHKALKATAETIDGLRAWTKDAIEAALRQQCEALGWHVRDLFMPVRVAVTGRTATPPLFETMETLGKARVQARIRAAIAALG